MGDSTNKNNTSRSISDQSAALFVSQDNSLASLLLNYNVTVRDYILLSFLNDQGPMMVIQLARVIGIEPQDVFRSLSRLGAAGLVLRDPKEAPPKTNEMARLTGRGQNIVRRINDQL